MVKKTAQKTATRDYLVEVKNPKPVEGKDGSYRFTLVVNGVTLYGMKSIAYKDKNTGEDRSFIAFPGYQGRDEQFYNNCWFPIDEKLQAIIEDQIAELLP